MSYYRHLKMYTLLFIVKLTFFNQPDLHMNNQASNKNLLDNVTIATLEQFRGVYCGTGVITTNKFNQQSSDVKSSLYLFS